MSDRYCGPLIRKEIRRSDLRQIDRILSMRAPCNEAKLQQSIRFMQRMRSGIPGLFLRIPPQALFLEDVH